MVIATYTTCNLRCNQSIADQQAGAAQVVKEMQPAAGMSLVIDTSCTFQKLAAIGHARGAPRFCDFLLRREKLPKEG
jgi:hypothetical protein